MPVDQPVVDARARGDVTNGGCRGSTFSEQVGGRLQNRRNDLSPAQGCTGPRRVGSCTSCSHMTTVPPRSLRSADLPGGRTLPVATTPYKYGRFIGRVGGLAVALGIGAAIANSPAIAAADDGQSSGSQAASPTSGSADSGSATGPSAKSPASSEPPHSSSTPSSIDDADESASSSSKPPTADGHATSGSDRETDTSPESTVRAQTVTLHADATAKTVDTETSPSTETHRRTSACDHVATGRPARTVPGYGVHVGNREPRTRTSFCLHHLDASGGGPDGGR